jgi:hypothetical protein
MAGDDALTQNHLVLSGGFEQYLQQTEEYCTKAILKNRAATIV